MFNKKGKITNEQRRRIYVLWSIFLYWKIKDNGHLISSNQSYCSYTHRCINIHIFCDDIPIFYVPKYHNHKLLSHSPQWNDNLKEITDRNGEIYFKT